MIPLVAWNSILGERDGRGEEKRFGWGHGRASERASEVGSIGSPSYALPFRPYSSQVRQTRNSSSLANRLPIPVSVIYLTVSQRERPYTRTSPLKSSLVTSGIISHVLLLRPLHPHHILTSNFRGTASAQEERRADDSPSLWPFVNQRRATKTLKRA